MYISCRYLLKKGKIFSNKQTQDVFLIIPVLEEQSIIKESVEHFAKLVTDKTHVVYVTSSKEKKKKNIPTTSELLCALKKNTQLKLSIVLWLKNAVMAHQINYAINKLTQQLKKDFIVGIYNVDSQITSSTISRILKVFENAKDRRFVVQQYTLYPHSSGGILSHIALWQNRWTLHFELGRVLVGENSYFSHICKTFNYVIGHGLFFTNKVWKEIGGIPQDVSNEDACMGLVLYAHDYKIYSIKNVEYALIAKNLKVYVKQQSVWFNGPLYAFLYAQKINSRHYPDVKFYFQCWMGAAKLFMHAIYWLFGPILIWFVVPIYFYKHPAFLSAWYLVAIYHCYFLNLIAMHFVNKINPHTITNVGNMIEAIVAYLLHCMGPIYTLIKIAKGKNSIKYKYKTEK